MLTVEKNHFFISHAPLIRLLPTDFILPDVMQEGIFDNTVHRCKSTTVPQNERV